MSRDHVQWNFLMLELRVDYFQNSTSHHCVIIAQFQRKLTIPFVNIKENAVRNQITLKKLFDKKIYSKEEELKPLSSWLNSLTV